MIVIIGTWDDHRASVVIDRLQKRDIPFLVFDTPAYPNKIRLYQDINAPVHGEIISDRQNMRVTMADITSVYYCNREGFYMCPDDPPELYSTIQSNIDSAAWSFFHCLEDRGHCLFVNPIEAANHHNYKTHLLQRFRAAGIRVPHTLVTNDPEAMIRFYREQNRSVIYKPPWGQSFTAKMTDDDLTGEKLNSLSNSPIMLQEFIDGPEFRAYVLGDEVFGIEVQSTELDINQDAHMKRVACTLPDEVCQTARHMSQVAGLVFSAIDIRRTASGEYVYFEANSSPDFTLDERVAGHPLCDTLVDLLKRGKG